MSKYARFTLILAATLGLAACDAETDAPGDQARVLLWPIPAHTDVAANTDQPGAPALGPEVAAIELAIDPTGETADVCACNSQSCVSEWIESTFGCGVCVSIVCDGTVIGGCVHCPQDPLLSAGTTRPLADDLPAFESLLPVD